MVNYKVTKKAYELCDYGKQSRCLKLFSDKFDNISLAGDSEVIFMKKA